MEHVFKINGGPSVQCTFGTLNRMLYFKGLKLNTDDIEETTIFNVHEPTSKI